MDRNILDEKYIKNCIFGFKKIRCSYCKSYSGYGVKYPQAIWTNTSNVICKEGNGCKKLCDCKFPIPDLRTWVIQDNNENKNIKYKCKSCNQWVKQDDYYTK
jgi:hypothetical protein